MTRRQRNQSFIDMQEFSWREHPLPGDEEKIKQVVRSSGFFSDEEIAIAGELVAERLEKGLASGYHFLFAEQKDTLVGYTCFGPIPGTQSSFDLYWIAVHEKFRKHGIGSGLLLRSEEIILKMGGTRIYAETSSRKQYGSTRAFYRRSGYKKTAYLADFYSPGDGKIIFVKERQE